MRVQRKITMACKSCGQQRQQVAQRVAARDAVGTVKAVAVGVGMMAQNAKVAVAMPFANAIKSLQKPIGVSSNAERGVKPDMSK
jgi:hypothetical protein